MSTSELDKLQKFAEALNEFATDVKNGKYIKQVGKECADAIADDIDYIFTSYIDKYYDSYHPKYYKRTRSLYDMYDVYLNGSIIGWHVGEVMPGGHRVDATNDTYIFDYMFEQGYHGGADSGPNDEAGNPHPGYMAWRWPAPSPGNHPYTLWGKMAVKSFSPSNLIDINIQRYRHNGDNISGHTLIERVRYAFKYVQLRYSIFDYMGR